MFHFLQPLFDKRLVRPFFVADATLLMFENLS